MPPDRLAYNYLLYTEASVFRNRFKFILTNFSRCLVEFLSWWLFFKRSFCRGHTVVLFVSSWPSSLAGYYVSIMLSGTIMWVLLMKMRRAHVWPSRNYNNTLVDVKRNWNYINNRNGLFVRIRIVLQDTKENKTFRFTARKNTFYEKNYGHVFKT